MVRLLFDPEMATADSCPIGRIVAQLLGELARDLAGRQLEIPSSPELYTVRRFCICAVSYLGERRIKSENGMQEIASPEIEGIPLGSHPRE